MAHETPSPPPDGSARRSIAQNSPERGRDAPSSRNPRRNRSVSRELSPWSARRAMTMAGGRKDFRQPRPRSRSTSRTRREGRSTEAKRTPRSRSRERRPRDTVRERGAKESPKDAPPKSRAQRDPDGSPEPYRRAPSKDRKRERSKDRSRGKDRDRSRDRHREKSGDRHRDKSSGRHRDKSRDRQRGKSGDRHRDKSGDRHRDRSRERRRDHSRERRRHRSRDRSRDRHQDRHRDRPRSKDIRLKERSRSPLPYRPSHKRRSRSPRPPSPHKRRRHSPSPHPRSRKPLPSQEISFRGTDNASQPPTKHGGAPPDREKPNFKPTGLLAKEANKIEGTKISLKYHEPAEARKPAPSAPWRLWIFKGADTLGTVELHTQSCWLLGRAAEVADIPLEHPSASQQHAAIQFRYIQKTTEDEFGVRSKKGRVRPYVIDLESSNGTELNDEDLEPGRYYELRDKDILRFGASEREYVVMLPPRE